MQTCEAVSSTCIESSNASYATQEVRMAMNAMRGPRCRYLSMHGDVTLRKNTFGFPPRKKILVVLSLGKTVSYECDTTRALLPLRPAIREIIYIVLQRSRVESTVQSQAHPCTSMRIVACRW